jgi:hypothetical protein
LCENEGLATDIDSKWLLVAKCLVYPYWFCLQLAAIEIGWLGLGNSGCFLNWK